jgi:D-glycero-beta-D-manno-heptose-7-phosphate kinase
MSTDTLVSYVEKFKDFTILVVGDVMLDHYVFGKVERLNPEAPVPVLHAQKEQDATGGAGNVAKNVAMLGAKALLVGVAGNDVTADTLMEAGSREGYEMTLVKDESRPTIRKTRFLVNAQQLLRVDFEDSKDVQGAIEKKLIDHIQSLAGEADAILISDYAKGAVTQAVVQAAMSAAKKHNIPIAADIKPSRAKFVVGVSFISPNLKEGYEFLGVNPLEHGQMNPSQVAQELHKKMKTDVYLTLSAGGVYVKTDSVDEQVIQDHVVQVFDVSGAGDTFMATVVLAQLAGASGVEAAKIANAAGAVVVGKVGSVGLTSKELIHMLVHDHE